MIYKEMDFLIGHPMLATTIATIWLQKDPALIVATIVIAWIYNMFIELEINRVLYVMLDSVSRISLTF